MAKKRPTNKEEADTLTQRGKGLAEYWNGVHKALHSRLMGVKKQLRNPTSGTNAERLVHELLDSYLPRRFSVESGYVVSADGAQSDHMDVLIVDTANIPPLSAEPAYKVYPSEAVVAAIEITGSPGSKVKRSGVSAPIPKLADDLLKLARLRKIARYRSYFAQVPNIHDSPTSFDSGEVSYALSPRCFLFTYGAEWQAEGTYERNLLKALAIAREHHDHVWLNAALSLKHGMFHFQPYSDKPPARFTSNWLLEFILYLNRAVSSIPTGAIDLQRYRPSVIVDERDEDE